MNKKDIINAIFYPRKSLKKQDSDDLLIEVAEGIKVGARLFLDNNLNPNIIYFHGNAELAQEYTSIAQMFNDFGLNLIVADYRGYGLSEGVPDKKNLHADSIKIFDYLLSYLNNNKYNNRLIVMGRSLGSASVCEIISKRIDFIDKCIIESGFATEYPLLKLMNINPENIDYSPLDGFGNLSKLKEYKKPIFFIHADMDYIIPISEAELMLESCGSANKDLLVAKGADHNNIIMVIQDIYFKKIKDFINE